eukprot:6061035-Prymnesium_polylepis.2
MGKLLRMGDEQSGRLRAAIALRPLRSAHIEQCALNLVLRGHVERRRRLVEDQDTWLRQQRARERDPLHLPAAQLLLVVRDGGGKALRQRADKTLRVRTRCSKDECGLVRSRHAIGNVVSEGALE